MNQLFINIENKLGYSNYNNLCVFDPLYSWFFLFPIGLTRIQDP